MNVYFSFHLQYPRPKQRVTVVSSSLPIASSTPATTVALVQHFVLACDVAAQETELPINLDANHPQPAIHNTSLSPSINTDDDTLIRARMMV